MTCPEKPSTPSFSWSAPDKENPARRGPSGVCPRLRGSRELAEASPQCVARYFVPADSTLRGKHDGYRLMACRDPVGGRLLTRNGNDWSARFPLVVEAVNDLKVRSCLEAPGLALPIRALARLAQVQESGRACSETRGGGGLG